MTDNSKIANELGMDPNVKIAKDIAAFAAEYKGNLETGYWFERVWIKIKAALDAKDAAHAEALQKLQGVASHRESGILAQLTDCKAKITHLNELIKLAEGALEYYAQFFEGKNGHHRREAMIQKSDFFEVCLPQMAEETLAKLRKEMK